MQKNLATWWRENAIFKKYDIKMRDIAQVDMHG